MDDILEEQADVRRMYEADFAHVYRNGYGMIDGDVICDGDTKPIPSVSSRERAEECEA